MAANILAGLIPIFSGAITGVLNKYFPKPEDKKAMMQLEADLQIALMTQAAEQSKALSEMIQAESTSESWLTRNWRPITLLTFLGIIVHDVVLVEYFNMFIDTASLKFIGIPDPLWDILLAMFGIYAAGRSGEKMVKGWKQ